MSRNFLDRMASILFQRRDDLANILGRKILDDRLDHSINVKLSSYLQERLVCMQQSLDSDESRMAT